MGINHRQRRQRSTTPHRRKVSTSTCRRIGLHGMQRRGGNSARNRVDSTMFDKMISVTIYTLLARLFDQQRRDPTLRGIVEVFELLHEAWAVAIQLEGEGDVVKRGAQLLGRGWVLPAVEPLVFALRRKCGRQQAD